MDSSVHYWGREPYPGGSPGFFIANCSRIVLTHGTPEPLELGSFSHLRAHRLGQVPQGESLIRWIASPSRSMLFPFAPHPSRYRIHLSPPIGQTHNETLPPFSRCQSCFYEARQLGVLVVASSSSH